MSRRDDYMPGAGFTGQRRYEGSPPPGSIRYVRLSANLTQAQAAALVFVSLRRWQGFEYGTSPIHPGLWELFCRKLAELQSFS